MLVLATPTSYSAVPIEAKLGGCMVRHGGRTVRKQSSVVSDAGSGTSERSGPVCDLLVTDQHCEHLYHCLAVQLVQ